MPVVTPAQRIRVYASPAVDPTQTTVLTPRAASLHSDPFQLATVSGITGYQPYLQQQTQGRRGRLDFKSKKVDVGAFTFTCQDPRIDEASGNDERWLSQFYGDETARSALARLRVEYEESLDFDPAAPNASTWRRLATLRVADVRQLRRLQFTLSTTDLADDLGSDCWIGDPHLDITYAQRAPLLPAALLGLWGDFPADLNYLPGQTIVTTGTYPRRVGTNIDQGDREYCVLTERVRSLASNVLEMFPRDFGAFLDFASAPGTSPRIRVRLNVSGVFQGWYWLTRAVAHYDDEEHWRMDEFAVVPAPELGGAVFPADGTDITWAWYETGPASDDSPILVGYVPAATLAADIVDGLFGELAVDGSPLHAVPRDGPSFANLAADPTLPLVWARIGERAVRRTWIADFLLKPLQLGLVVNESGQVTLLDLRRQQTVATDLPEITDADLMKDMAGETSAWVSGDAITDIAASVVRYHRLNIQTDVVDSKDRWPSVPAALVVVPRDETEVVYQQLSGDQDLRALDFASKAEVVDFTAFATGFSPQIATSAALTAKQVSRQGKVTDLANEIFAMFGHGAHYITLPARRTGVAEDTRAGLRRLLTASSIVDPRTNLRGTSQIALCIERNEQGIGSTLVFVALGLNTAADPPTDGTPVLGTECETTIDWPITLNAAGDAVQVQVLQQPIGDPTPDAIDVRWTDAVMVLATGTVAVGPLLSGYDVYLRARSEPAGGGTLPSDWVYPTPAFLATCGPETIAGCILSNITANGATLSWDAGTAEGQIYILVDGVLVRTLVEGTTSVTLTGLVDGAVITASSSPTGSPGCAAVFASNPDIITDPPPDPDPTADPSCGGTTPPRVHVFYVGPSAIRVGLMTEDPSFNIEVRSADVVPGTGPPIIPPGNPGGGVRIGALWHTPLDLCAGMGCNGAVRVTSWRPSASNYIERILDDAAARGLSVVVIPGFKSEYTTNGSSSGPFSPSLYNAMIDNYATVFPRLAAHIAAKVFRSVMPIDEPNVLNAWGGIGIPLSQVAAAMAYTKAAFPGLLVGVRADPSKLQGISWAGKMDFCVGQKNTLNSTESCAVYAPKIKAGAAALGLYYYLGLNPINGGADSSYFPGTATGRYMISPAEWPQFNALVADPTSLGELSWQYDPARPEYFGNAAVRSAMRAHYAILAGVGA